RRAEVHHRRRLCAARRAAEAHHSGDGAQGQSQAQGGNGLTPRGSRRKMRQAGKPAGFSGRFCLRAGGRGTYYTRLARTGGRRRPAMELMAVFSLVNFFFAVVIGLYFLNLLRAQQASRGAIERESRKELERLRKLKQVSLTEPLAEKTRPATLDDIIGQEDGLKTLRAALCGPNPQHVIIYGPPGVGKTAAARVVLEEAKRN